MKKQTKDKDESSAFIDDEGIIHGYPYEMNDENYLEEELTNHSDQQHVLSSCHTCQQFKDRQNCPDRASHVRTVHPADKNIQKFDYGEINRIVYIWARYQGKRDSTKEGKHYDKSDLDELIRRLKKYRNDINSFEEGFEKVKK